MTARQKRILAAIAAVEAASEVNAITPRALWESARDSEHPLHDEFEWDDSVAAIHFRDEQARRLLRIRVSVVYEDRVVDAPICVRSPEAPAGEANYMRTTRLLDDKERSQAVLLEEIERVVRSLERARMVAGALGLSEECENLIAQITRLQKMAKAA